MLATRRLFVATLSAAAAGALFAKPKRALSILILDGIGAIGAEQAAYALARGHKVTLFNRGKRDEELPAEVEYLEGDRNGRFAALEGRTWDVVIDNAAAHQPKWVKKVAPLLQASKQYIFLSNVEAEAELEVETAFPKRSTIVRAGALAGPNDKTDRFTYWAVRVAQGGEVLAPAGDTSFIDIRDLAEWMVRLAEQGTLGRFDAGVPLSMQKLLEGIRSATGSNATFIWVPNEFLTARDARVPVWAAQPFDTKTAVAAGLTFRPLAETVRAALAWHESRDVNRRAALRSGLTPEREAELLAAWKAAGKKENPNR